MFHVHFAKIDNSAPTVHVLNAIKCNLIELTTRNSSQPSVVSGISIRACARIPYNLHPSALWHCSVWGSSVCIFTSVMARFMHILSTARHVFGKSRKITSFRGKSWGLPVGKKLTASENYFHSEKLGLYTYFLLQLQLNLQLKKCDSLLLRTTLQAGCHETA